MDEREALRKMGRSGVNGPVAVAAATVILVRDGESGAEVLMLKRDSRLSFAGGLWVFPGGRVDPEDYDDLYPADLDRAERNAAVREATEEASLTIDPEALVRFSHWTPPPQANKRFSTAFFIAPAPAGAVVIDDGEIRDHQWVSAPLALAAHLAGGIELAPPTFITLTQLGSVATASEMLEIAATRGPEHFSTQVVEAEGHVVALYHGDAGYGGGDPLAPGHRHRLWLDPAGWRYERSEGAPGNPIERFRAGR